MQGCTMARQIFVLFLLHTVCSVLQVASQVSAKPDDCSVKSADIAIVIDASGSIDNTEWKQALNFATSVVRGYDVGKDKVRVALIVFSNTAQIVFDFNKYTTKAQVIAAIAAAPKESQNTNTHLALDLARTKLFQTSSGMRPNVPRMLIVITDGQSTNAGATVTSAANLKKTKTTVIAVGVKGAQLNELQTIASAPSYVYNYADFNKLVALQDQFKKAICTVVKKIAPTRPPPPKPTTPACVVQTADIAFILDGSGSVAASEWTQSLKFAKNIVQGYDIGANKVRVALIEFSSSPKIVFDFNKYPNKAQLISAITNAKQSGGGTDTHKALDLAKNSLFQTSSGMRNGVPNIVFVITDGRSGSAAQTIESAKGLHGRGITVFAIGVKGADLKELEGIASDKSLVSSYTNFNQLDKIQTKFNAAACKVVKEIAPTTRPPPTTPKACLVRTADIAFILDGSGSVASSEWTQALKFAKNIVKEYDIGKNKVRVALIEFSGSPQIVFDFNKYPNKAQLISAITNANQSGGGTDTHKALDLAKNSLFQTGRGMRNGVPNIVFVITDGKSNQADKTLASAKSLHARGITVFAIGVKGAVQKELEGIASDKSLVSSYTNFNQLDKIQTKFNAAACKVVVDKVAPTTPIAECTLNSADIVFVVDTSSSVGIANFNLTKIFLSSMMVKLDFRKNRVGVIQFNDKATTVFELKQNNNKQSAQTSVARMIYDIGSATKISAALKYMRERSFTATNGDRPNVANLAIVVTDGQAKDPFRTQFEGNISKTQGITLFTVGIGDDVNSRELRALASQPSFFYHVKNFPSLSAIGNNLATQLCQGFTPPPITTQAPCICKDRDDNCRGYGSNICFEAKYRSFAESQCPAYCDLCPKGCVRYLPPPKPCKDTIDCWHRIDACTPKYKGYALQACPRYCNLCHELNPPMIIQTTTTTTTGPPTTHSVPPKTTSPEPKPFLPCDVSCYDKLRNCKDYQKADCQRKEYGNYFKYNCAEYCGFCTPETRCITTPGPCVDKTDCSGYTEASCVKYPDWALENCPRHCHRCPGQTTPALVQGEVCEDKEDCRGYGKDVCTDYPDFSKKRCRVFCKLCTPPEPVAPQRCADKRDCTAYKPDLCRNPDYRKFMLDECRLYCNACNDEH